MSRAARSKTQFSPASAQLDHATFFSSERLAQELRLNCRALGLPEASIEPLVARVSEAVLTWLTKRDIITKSDLERVVAAELQKYSPDLALLYLNKDLMF